MGKIWGDKGINAEEIQKWKSSTGSEQSRWLVISISPSTVPKISCWAIKSVVCFYVCANSCVCMLGSSFNVFFFVSVTQLSYLYKGALTLSCWIPWPSTQRTLWYRSLACKIVKCPKLKGINVWEKAVRREENQMKTEKEKGKRR